MDFCIFRSYAEWKSTLLLYDFNFFSSLLLTLVSSKIYLGRGKRSTFHSNKKTLTRTLKLRIKQSITCWSTDAAYFQL